MSEKPERVVHEWPARGHQIPRAAPVSRIPPEAIEAVERVLAFRAEAVAEVPGSERWRSTTVEHQCRKAESHAHRAAVEAAAFGDGDWGIDEDTGEHHAAHAAARALLACALYYQRKDPR